MSNARRRVARSGWQGPNRRSTLMQAPAREEVEIKMQSARESMATTTLQAEILESPTEEMMPLSALFECAREAREKGFSRGIGVGIVIGGLLTLAVHAIMVLL